MKEGCLLVKSGTLVVKRKLRWRLEDRNDGRVHEECHESLGHVLSYWGLRMG